MTSLAYFAQDLIGDSLVWVNQIQALAAHFAPCAVTVFCPKGLAELFECMAFCDKVIAYDPTTPWSEEDVKSFGRFNLVVNTRYDADSIGRVEALDHAAAYGFENVDIPEIVCRRVYTGYIPLSRWDDYHLRRETSVTEQGAELIRLLAPDYHCDFVSFDKAGFARDAPETADADRIVFVLGASNPDKSWGLGNYFEVARFVRERGINPFFLLGPNERDLAPRIDEEGFAKGVCLPFRKIAGLFDPDYGTRCVIGNDTGLMHLACMIGAPSVTIMPHGTHFTWFPYGGDHRAPHICLAPDCTTPLCVNKCRDVARCVGRVSTAEVKNAVCNIFESPLTP